MDTRGDFAHSIGTNDNAVPNSNQQTAALAISLHTHPPLFTTYLSMTWFALPITSSGVEPKRIGETRAADGADGERSGCSVDGNDGGKAQ